VVSLAALTGIELSKILVELPMRRREAESSATSGPRLNLAATNLISASVLNLITVEEKEKAGRGPLAQAYRGKVAFM
jgi:hypothetical protein